jgi:hypothetical protein
MRQAKSRRIDREYPTRKKWSMGVSYTILSRSVRRASWGRLAVFKVATWDRANRAHKHYQ